MEAKLLSVWIKTGNSIDHSQPQDSLLILQMALTTSQPIAFVESGRCMVAFPVRLSN